MLFLLPFSFLPGVRQDFAVLLNPPNEVAGFLSDPASHMMWLTSLLSRVPLGAQLARELRAE